MCSNCPGKKVHAKGLCAGCYQRQRRQTNPTYARKHRLANMLWKRRHPEGRLNLERRYRYSLKKDEYETIIATAKGVCELCGNVPKKLCLDHNHDTKEVRGMLCDKCNKALGAYDYIKAMEPALNNYLSRPPGWFRAVKNDKTVTLKTRVL